MRVVELKPEIKHIGEMPYISFDCPVCKTHRIEIPMPPHPQAWELTGCDFGFYDITLSPSVAHETSYADGIDKKGRSCRTHFFVRDGMIEMV